MGRALAEVGHHRLDDLILMAVDGLGQLVQVGHAGAPIADTLLQEGLALGVKQGLQWVGAFLGQAGLGLRVHKGWSSTHKMVPPYQASNGRYSIGPWAALNRS